MADRKRMDSERYRQLREKARLLIDARREARELEAARTLSFGSPEALFAEVDRRAAERRRLQGVRAPDRNRATVRDGIELHGT